EFVITSWNSGGVNSLSSELVRANRTIESALDQTFRAHAGGISALQFGTALRTERHNPAVPNSTSSPGLCVNSRERIPYRLMKEQYMRLKQTLWKTIVGAHLIAAAALAQPPTYKVIDLGVVGPNGQPFTIANNGRVAGATQVGDIIHAWLRYKSR